MSRGLGKVERDVLTVLEGGQLLSSADIAARVFGHPEPSAAAYASTCRALASLARKGLAEADGTRAWGTLQAVAKSRRKRMRLQSTRSQEERGLDPYFSPPVAVYSLIALERQYLPQRVWEPAAGNGAIVKVLCRVGYAVHASDIADYGLAGCEIVDYLEAPRRPGIDGIVTNPPYAKAVPFIEKALSEVPYVAMLLRTNFLEAERRDAFFAAHPPARIWVAALRLPMMHYHGWTGRKVPSNTSHSWFIWDRDAARKNSIERFNYKNLGFDWRAALAES